MAFNRRKVLQITAGLVVLGCAAYLLFLPRRGKVIETWQTGNNSFRLRVTAYNEKNTFPALGGGYYVFESAPVSSDQCLWVGCMQLRLTVVIVGRFGMRLRIPRSLKATGTTLSLKVSISEDGNGEMVFKLTGDTNRELKTKDYGRHWSTEA